MTKIIARVRDKGYSCGTMMIYQNREQAGQNLGRSLLRYHVDGDVLVLGLSRGGVPVAAQIARALNAPLDVMVVRKLGVPWNPELALGAIASGGGMFINRAMVEAAGVTPDELVSLTAREQRELERREHLYRPDSSPLRTDGHTVILVDDGMATGATMLAAVRSVLQLGSGRVVVAVPVASREAIERLKREVDEVVCPLVPEPFQAVGLHYHDFAPVADDEVCRSLGVSMC
jgi:predicted phosphoribosyltransferase